MYKRSFRQWTYLAFWYLKEIFCYYILLFVNMTGSLVDLGSQDIIVQNSDFLTILSIKVCCWSSKMSFCVNIHINAIIIYSQNVFCLMFFKMQFFFIKPPPKGQWTLEYIGSNPLTINVTASSSFDISSYLREISSEGFFYPISCNPVLGQFC